MVLVLGLLAVGGKTAWAEAGWAAVADTIFQPAVQGGGTAGVLLPSSIAQDRAGFLWEGGEGGLGRWDGYHFRLYVDDPARPDGLRDHNVLALHLDGFGRLWVGTVTGGLAQYDAPADRFRPVSLGGGRGAEECVWSMDDDGDGGLWVGASAGLFHLDATARTVAWLRHDAAKPDSLPLAKVEAVLRDRHGTLWVGGTGGLARAVGGAGGFARVELPIEGGDPPEVTRLVEDGAGRLWIGTRSQGAYVIDAGRGRAGRVSATAPKSGQAVAPEILAIADGGRSRMWLSTGGSGIVEVTEDGRQAKTIRHNSLVPGSLPKDTVSAIYRDRSGLLWVGTVQGLSRYDPANQSVLTLQGDPGRTEGLRLNGASSVLAWPGGTLWVGSEDSGLQILDPAGQTTALSLPLVFAMAQGMDSRVYLGTRAGLFVADQAGNAVSRVDWLARPPGAPVNALLAMDGTLWLGGGADGVWALRPGAARLQAVRHLSWPLLTNDTVYGLAPAPGGKLAVGTDRGFNLIDPASGAVERVEPDTSDPQGLSPGGVMSFAIDRQQRLWVGTDAAGIDVMVGRDGAGRPKFRHIGTAEGLPDLDISKLLLDRQGRIWASTDHGLAVVDPQTLTARALRAPQGVMVTSYWSNSGDRTQDGELIFGGAGGLTIVRPEQVTSWSYQPAIVVTGIRLAGRPDEAPQAASGPGGGWVEVPADGNSLAVEFAALDFSAPELNRYAYRLEGFDRDWIETDAAHRVAAYTNLPPGEYTLRLRGSNREGVWSSETASLRIRVLPAWFQTIWFRMAAGGTAMLAVAALVQARTVLLRKRQRTLERQVAERTAELRASQQELQAFAYLDTLTGLPNRRAFNEEFDRLAAAEAGEIFALVLVDLDGFKKVNDHFGHQAGDAVLAASAARMRHAVRTRDFIARLGGDEFAILMRAVDRREPVDQLCARIIGSVAMPVSVSGTFVTVGASIGAALFPVHGQTPDELYRHVDLALYDAKRSGRGVWCWYEAAAEADQAVLF